MNRIAYMLMSVIAFVSMYVYVPPYVHACDCLEPKIEESFKKDDAVFEGTVLEIQDWKDKNELGQAILFEVKKNWKGADFSQIIVYTSGGTCAFPFSKGENYLVFSSQHRGENQLYTTSCSGTKLVAEAESNISMLSQIAKGDVPTKQVNLKEDMPNQSKIHNVAIVSAVAVALVVIIVSVILIRRVRKK